MIKMNKVESRNLTLYQSQCVKYDVQIATRRIRLLRELIVHDLRRASSTRNSVVMFVICLLNEKIQKHKQCAVK
jgi:hypothetical protein